ncbi:MAG: helix-turn-helix transcriptional regulator [Chloroflexi bacterium]|nr:helix-turn-helix transcriptional regulator [Chloroflexota bacterium]
MVDIYFEDDEPCYVISVVAKLVDMHPQTLRYYERVGLIKPSRTAGRIRLYSQRDVDNIRKIARITDELGVKNLAGVEVIINMTQRIEELQQQLTDLEQRYQQETAELRGQLQICERMLQQYRTGFLTSGSQPDELSGRKER